MYCAKDTSAIQLFGQDSGDYGGVSVLVLPCNFGLEPGEVPPDNPTCNTNKTEQIDFINPLDFSVMYESTKFNQSEYELDKMIVKESRFFH